MASYLEIRNTLQGISTTIASRAQPAAPSRRLVAHQDGEEGNDIVQEEAVGQAA
jgi:hypothetical protein